MSLFKELKSINKTMELANRPVKSDESIEFIERYGNSDLKKALLIQTRQADKSRRNKKIQSAKFEAIRGQETAEARAKREAGEIQRDVGFSLDESGETTRFTAVRNKKGRKKFASAVARKEYEQQVESDIAKIESSLVREREFKELDSTDIPNWYFFLEPILKHYLSMEDYRKGEALQSCKKALANPDNVKMKLKCIRDLPDKGEVFNREVKRVTDKTEVQNLQLVMDELDADLDNFEDHLIPEMIDRFVRKFSVENSDGYKMAKTANFKIRTDEQLHDHLEAKFKDDIVFQKELKKLSLDKAKERLLERTAATVKENNSKRADELEVAWEVAKEWLRDPANRVSSDPELTVPEDIAKTLNDLQRKVPNLQKDKNRFLNNLDILFRYREMFRFPLKEAKAEGVTQKFIVSLYLDATEQILMEKLVESGTWDVAQTANSKNYRAALKQRDLLKQKIANEQIYLDMADDIATERERISRSGRYNDKNVLLDKVRKIKEECLQGDSLGRFNLFLLRRRVDDFTELENEDLSFLEQKFSLDGISVYNELNSLKGKRKERILDLLSSRDLDDLSFRELRDLQIELFPSLTIKKKLSDLDPATRSRLVARAREAGEKVKNIRDLEKLDKRKFDKLVEKDWNAKCD